MSEKSRKLTARERQIYVRLLARTRPYVGRLALAVVFGLLFGGSVFGLLFSAKGGMAQVFGGRATRLQASADAWLQSWYGGNLNHDLLLTIAMLAVLLLNTIISQGAFRQHELEIDLILLAEKEESLARQVQLAETPIEVEKKARELGMVPAAAPVFLRLSDGKILGEPVPAEPETTPVDFADAPGILPTPDPSASASDGATADGADATTGVDPALDPATGLDAGATGSTGATAASPSAQPSAEPSAGAATNGTTADQDQATSNQSGQATEGGNQ